MIEVEFVKNHPFAIGKYLMENLVLRPSAKLKTFFYFLLFSFLIFITSILIFYIQCSLDSKPISHSISLNLERESFIDLKLINFYAKSISDEKTYLAIKSDLDKNSDKFENREYLKNKIQFDLNVYDNECKYEIPCSQIYIPLSDVSGSVWRGLIGIEDNRFLVHTGVDWRSIVRAFYINIKAGRIVQGGSTLTQQLVKNIYLSSEKTFTRKLKEAIYSIILELKYSKDVLIEAYLNNVYWGTYRGLKLYGIKAASLFYFNKHPNNLTEFEAAILIGMLKGPGLYSPFNKNKENIKSRANIVYQKLIEDKYFIGKTETWSEANWNSWFKSKFEERKLFLESLSKIQIPTYDNFLLAFFLDQKINDLRKNYPNGDFAYHVIGIGENNLRNEIFSKSSIIKQPKNIGSLLKPIVYSKLFEKFKPETQFSTTKYTLSLLSGDWTPNDHYEETASVTLSFALLKSLNIPYLRAVEKFGFKEMEKFLGKRLNSLKKPLSEYPSQLLGSIELSVNSVLELYQDFFKDKCSNEGTQTVIDILSSPELSTTSSWVKELGQSKFFGKTGTSNNGYDNWYVFYDYRDLYVVWIGHVGNRDVGRFALSGAGVAFEVLRKFLTSRAKNIGQNNCES